ncbi:MAG: c-type cytochrome [Acidobacteriota bacterium]
MRRLAPALVIVATASVAARGSDEAAPPDDWLQHCAPCHGVEADGRGAAASSLFPPPRSLRAAAFLKLDDQEIARVIRLGGKATGRSAAMPSFDRTLGANRITALVAYLKKLPRQERSASPLVFAAGDPGAALYAAHCQDCHGSSGMADGKNSALLVPAPRPLPETLGGATEEQIQHAIEGHAWWSAGAMPAFGGVLSDGAILLLARTLAEAARPSSGTAAAEARTGREIFEDLGCRGCHPMAGIEPRPRAPDLASAGTRLRAGWLVTFLQKPVQVRPIGHPPGSHARMPTFGLNAADARDIATALGADPARATMGAADPGLIASGGCLAPSHGRRRGRVGPDLALAKDRLRNGGVEDALLGRTAMPARDVTPVEVKAYTRALLGGQKMDYFDHGSIVLGRALMEDLACASRQPDPGPGAAAAGGSGSDVRRRALRSRVPGRVPARRPRSVPRSPRACPTSG